MEILKGGTESMYVAAEIGLQRHTLPNDARLDPDSKRLEMRISGDGQQLDATDLDALSAYIRIVGNQFDPQNPTTPVQWRLKLPRSVTTIVVDMQRRTQAQLLIDGPSPKLDVRVQGRFARLDLGATAMATLRVQDSEVHLGPTGRSRSKTSIAKVECWSAKLRISQRNVNQVVISGNCHLVAHQTPIGGLNLHQQCKLQIVTEDCAVRQVVPHRSREQQHFGDVDFVLLDGSKLTADTILKSARFALERKATLTSTGEVSDLTVRGPGTFEIETLAANLTFGTPAPMLNMSSLATLAGSRGSIRLGRTVDATIIGDSTGPSLVIEDVLADPSEFTGLSLLNVALPGTLTGLRIVKALDKSAHHVTPRSEKSKLKAHARDAPLSPIASGDTKQRFTDALYAEALADLASTKGAPASVRAVLAWRAYRSRNASAPALFERRLLSAYRLIGYGERIGPPFVTYGASAAVMASISLYGEPLQLSLDGLQHWLMGFIDWLATPLHVLRLTGEREGSYGLPQPWDTFGRLVVAIPFATAALTLRKYVKRDSSDS